MIVLILVVLFICQVFFLSEIFYQQKKMQHFKERIEFLECKTSDLTHEYRILRDRIKWTEKLNKEHGERK